MYCYLRQPSKMFAALLLAVMASVVAEGSEIPPSPIPNRRQRRSELGAVPSCANCAFKRTAHGSSGRGNIWSGHGLGERSRRKLAGEWAQLRVDHSESRECCGRVLFLSDYVYDSQRVRPFHRRDFRHVYIR